MIISIDAEKAFNRIQQPFMLQTLNKLGIDGMYLKIIKAIYNKKNNKSYLQQQQQQQQQKAIYNKPTANIILTGQKLKALPLKTGTRHAPSLTIPIQHSTGSSIHSNKARKGNKGYSIRKRGSQTISICRCIIVYLGDHIVSAPNVLKMISIFSKVSAYKINVQKSQAFLFSHLYFFIQCLLSVFFIFIWLFFFFIIEL